MFNQYPIVCTELIKLQHPIPCFVDKFSLIASFVFYSSQMLQFKHKKLDEILATVIMIYISVDTGLNKINTR